MKTISLLFTLFLMGCISATENEITGKWFMHQVIQNGLDVTSEHNPQNERFIILKRDGTFESGGKHFDKNTGKYVFNSVDHTLFLDSDAGPEDDSQWKVTVQGDTMHWQGYGSEWASGFEIIHLKEKKN